MELVDGPTLSERLRAERLPLAEVIEIAVQVADALEYAHEKGIVHRDLKPGNVKLTKDGKVKVLDFGLAKAMASEMSGGNPDNSPTLTAAMSKTGVILGTAAYMSPEQARGAHVDRRSDVWSFGVMLFEMLTGRQMFGGETVADSLASVLKSPIDLNDLPAETPVALRRLLKRCLDRDPRKRLRDMGDAKLELLAEPVAPAASVEAAPLITTAAPSRAAWALAGLALLAAAGFAWMWWTKPVPAPGQVRFTIPPLTSFSLVGAPVVSPDGKWLAFVLTDRVRTAANNGQLYLRRLDSLDMRKVDDAFMTGSLHWSPDSRWVLFRDYAKGMIRRAQVDGGTPETVGAWSPNSYGLALRSDDTLFVAVGGALRQMKVTGGEPKSVPITYGGKPEQNLRWPRLLPGERHLLYLSVRLEGGGELRVADLKSGEAKAITKAEGAGWYDSGHLLFARGGALMAVPFDLAKFEMTGEPFRVEDAVMVGNTRFGGYSAGAGVLALRRDREMSSSVPAWYGRDGKRILRLHDQQMQGAHYEVSPDGKLVAFHNSGDDAQFDVWIADIERRVTSRLTSHAARDWVMTWSPDSKKLAFLSGRDGENREEVYLMTANSPGSEQPLLVNGKYKHHLAWRPDGSVIVFEMSDSTNKPVDLWAMPTNGDKSPYPVVASEFSDAQPSFSPDGRWLAYISNATGRYEVYIREFSKGVTAPVVQLTTSGAIQPRWRKDGREIVVLGADGNLLALPVTAKGDEIVPGAPTQLFPTELFGRNASTHFAMTPDAQRFLLPDAGSAADQDPIHVITNWRPSRGSGN
nr:protein kinase [Bryobacter sp.]